MDRNLDGIYFRVKRGEKHENVCFSDLSREERADIEKRVDNKPEQSRSEWWKSIAYHLADQLKLLGDEFDIVGK